MPFPFFTDAAHRTLDAHLLTFHNLVGQFCHSAGAAHPTIVATATAILGEAEQGRLLRPGWKETWMNQGGVATGWFGDVERDETAKRLLAVVVELVRLVMSPTYDYREQENYQPLTQAVKSYLIHRGFQLPMNTHDKIEWTTAEGPSHWAKLFGVSTATITEWLKENKIRNKQMSSKYYMIAIDDLPAKHQGSYRAK